MKNDLGLSKGLLNSVSSLLNTSSKQKQEEAKADHERLAAHVKPGSMRPLSMEEAKVASYAAKAPERRVSDTITQLYTQSVADHNAKAQAEAAVIKTAYGKMGGVKPVMEAELSPKQKKLAAVAGDKKEIDAMDLHVLRSRKTAQATSVSDEKILDGESIDELNKETLGSYVAKATDSAADNAISLGYKAGRRQGGSEHVDKLAKRIAGIKKAAGKMVQEEEEVGEAMSPQAATTMKTKDGNIPPKHQVVKHLIGTSMDPRYTKPNNTVDMKTKGHATPKKIQELQDTPGNSAHQCAIHVKHATMGEGRTLTSQHAQPDTEGEISWYTVMFEHGIEKVDTKDLEVLVSESHMSHKPKKKKMMNEDEVHNTKSYSLNKQTFNDGMKYSSGESGTIHKDDSYHAKETEAGASSTSDNIVYGIHDKNKGTTHGVSISMSKKTTPEKVAKAAGHDSVLPVHKAVSNHHNDNNYTG